MLGPPCLWAIIHEPGLLHLRRGNLMLDELQQIIYSPTIYAETELLHPRNGDFLRFLNFTPLQTDDGRALYQRRI